MKRSKTRLKRRGAEDQAEMDYLLSCLRSTPKQRLDWLEEAHGFLKKTRSLKARKYKQ